jgi:hypothetical protein
MRLVALYNRHIELNNYYDKWLNICQFRDTLLAAPCQWSEKQIDDKNIILIGDLLSDRGHCDFYILYILQYLYIEDINYKILFSNHDSNFLRMMEQFIFKQSDFYFELANYCDVSMQELLYVLFGTNENILGHRLVKNLINTKMLCGAIDFNKSPESRESEKLKQLEELHSIYTQHLCLLHHQRFDGNDYFFTHAPTNTRYLSLLAKELDIEISPFWHDDDYHNNIDIFNQKFRDIINFKELSSHEIKSQLEPRLSIGTSTIYSRTHSLLYNFPWTRKISHPNINKFYNVFGHLGANAFDGDLKLINLDAGNDVGKHNELVNRNLAKHDLTIEIQQSFISGPVPCFVY